MADMPKKIPITEIAMILTAIGGALQAYVLAVSTPSEPLAHLNGISIAILSLGGSLGGYRLSKKLTELKKD